MDGKILKHLQRLAHEIIGRFEWTDKYLGLDGSVPFASEEIARDVLDILDIEPDGDYFSPAQLNYAMRLMYEIPRYIKQRWLAVRMLGFTDQVDELLEKKYSWLEDLPDEPSERT